MLRLNLLTQLTDLAQENKIWYLAHRYSGTEQEQKENFDKSNKLSAVLFMHGIVFYAPISMTHPIDKIIADDLNITSFRDWYTFDLVLCGKCDGIILPPDWEQSKGCKIEYDFFVNAKKDVFVLSQELYDRMIYTKKKIKRPYLQGAFC